MGKMIDVRGVRFGRLVVLDRLPAERERAKIRWLCKCDCGATSVTTVDQLQSGHTQSCGCLHREGVAKRNRTHGFGKPGAYGSWSNMIQRCRNPRCPSYPGYGGRGITVCERWVDFAAFYEDMGDRPVGGSIERNDVNGNYEPGNCRWATSREQARNTRRTRPVSYQGRTMCLADWATETGMHWETLYARIVRLGWSVEDAINRPVQ